PSRSRCSTRPSADNSSNCHPGPIMQAHDMPFTKLINVDQGAREHFHVPKYQREYTWGKWEWEQLLNDIEDNDPGYFMGSIICVYDNELPTASDELIFQV